MRTYSASHSTFRGYLGSAGNLSHTARNLDLYYSSGDYARSEFARNYLDEPFLDLDAGIGYLAMMGRAAAMEVFGPDGVSNQRKVELLLHDEIPEEITLSILDGMEGADFVQIKEAVNEESRNRLDILFHQSAGAAEEYLSLPAFDSAEVKSFLENSRSPGFIFMHASLRQTIANLDHLQNEHPFEIWSAAVSRLEPKTALAYIFCKPLEEEPLVELIRAATGDDTFALKMQDTTGI